MARGGSVPTSGVRPTSDAAVCTTSRMWGPPAAFVPGLSQSDGLREDVGGGRRSGCFRSKLRCQRERDNPNPNSRPPCSSRQAARRPAFPWRGPNARLPLRRAARMRRLRSPRESRHHPRRVRRLDSCRGCPGRSPTQAGRSAVVVGGEFRPARPLAPLGHPRSAGQQRSQRLSGRGTSR
jgi:hypothetical protein